MVERMDFWKIMEYIGEMVPKRPPEIRKMEAYAKKTGFPIIGPSAGQFCYLAARMINARRVFEMGSGYGYSTAWFTRAIIENCGINMDRKNSWKPVGNVSRCDGEVFHVVWDEKLSKMAKKHIGNLGYSSVVRYHVAEAIETLGKTRGRFDLIFNDIEKECYPDSLRLIKEKLRPGGILIADNVLWGGYAMDKKSTDKATKGIQKFNHMISRDPDWTASIVPIRDGLMLAVKR